MYQQVLRPQQTESNNRLACWWISWMVLSDRAVVLIKAGRSRACRCDSRHLGDTRRRDAFTHYLACIFMVGRLQRLVCRHQLSDSLDELGQTGCQVCWFSGKWCLRIIGNLYEIDYSRNLNMVTINNFRSLFNYLMNGRKFDNKRNFIYNSVVNSFFRILNLEEITQRAFNITL